MNVCDCLILLLRTSRKQVCLPRREYECTQVNSPVVDENEC